MNISAYLGVAGLVDVGYRFYTTNETAVAARVTAGIVDAGDGWYSAEVTLPATTESVRWDSTGTAEAKAREYWPDPWGLPIPDGYPAGTAGKILGDNINATISSRATPVQVQTELGTYGALKPTVAARTLDVSVGGEAGIDWANIGAPATAQNLSATTISTSQVVASVTSPVALTAAYDAAKTAATQASVNVIDDFVDSEVGAIKTVTDKLDSALELDGAVYRYTTNALEQAPAGGGGGATADAIADAVWDELISGHLTAGSTGNALNAAGSSGDPWSTPLPGAYGAGTAGKIIGDNMDAKVSSRSVYAGTDTPGTIAINAVTDKLNTMVEVDGAVYRYTTNALEQAPTGGGGGADPWNVLLPGAYGAGTAGNILGSNLNATVSSRATPAQVQTELNTYGALKPTVVARTLDVSATGEAGLDWANIGAPATTQNLSATTISTSQTVGSVTNPVTLTVAYDAAKTAATQASVNTIDGRLDTEIPAILAAVDTEVAAIKAKTDNLPASPASVGDIPTAVQNAAATRDVSNAAPPVGSLGADVKSGISTAIDPVLIADEVLKRDWQLVSGEAAYCVLNALRFLRDAWEVKSDGTLIVYKENGQIAWTRSVQADADALPITGVQ